MISHLTAIFYKCQKPTANIINAAPTVFKQNVLIQLISETNVNCSLSLANEKVWTLYGQNEEQIVLKNNPTINYAELILQPQTLPYGLYRVVYTLTMTATNLIDSSETFIQIIPSGLVLSTLKSSQPIYGGTIQVTRGQNQSIPFNPYLFTYDIDNMAVITSLSFKYSCQIIDSNIAQGYPLNGLNQTIYLDDFKSNASLSNLNTCFKTTGWAF